MTAKNRLKFTDCAAFVKLRASFEVGCQKSKNLIDSKGDLCFGWNKTDACVLAFNWRTSLLEGNDVDNFQTLVPSVQQCFQVDHLSVSNDCKYLALSGTKGVSVMELPAKLLPRNTCRTANLDEILFSSDRQIEVRQLHWHPKSRTYSRLLVLLSDNTIRVYDNGTLCHVWIVGPVHSQNTVQTADNLGDYTIDFDVAPPIKANKLRTYSDPMNRRFSDFTKDLMCGKGSHFEWPIVLLRRNGNIYVLRTGYDTSRPCLQGPLAITKNKRNNCKLKSCALIVIPSMPATLVLAQTNGKLHHCLLFEKDINDDTPDEAGATVDAFSTKYGVYLLETVKLELGVADYEQCIAQCDRKLVLKKDITNGMRYFAYHSTRLHSITLNFVDHLQSYLDNGVASDMRFNTPSTAEFLVCTKVGLSGAATVLMGLVILQKPNTIMLFFASGQTTFLELLHDHAFTLSPYESERNVVEGVVDLSTTFVTPYVVKQPTSLAKKQSEVQLPVDCMEILRCQSVHRIERTHMKIAENLKYTRSCQQIQRAEMIGLECEYECISNKARRLIKAYETINNKHQVMLNKVRQLLQCLATLPQVKVTGSNEMGDVDKMFFKLRILENRIGTAKIALKKNYDNIAVLHGCVPK